MALNSVDLNQSQIHQNISTDSFCANAGPGLGLVSIVISAVGLFATFLNTVFLAVLQKVHLNTSTRLCLTSMGIGVLLLGFTGMYRSLTGIYALMNRVSPSKAITCALVNTPAMASGVAIIVSLAGLAIERWMEFRKAEAKANHKAVSSGLGFQLIFANACSVGCSSNPPSNSQRFIRQLSAAPCKTRLHCTGRFYALRRCALIYGDLCVCVSVCLCVCVSVCLVNFSVMKQ